MDMTLTLFGHLLDYPFALAVGLLVVGFALTAEY
jgi:hypothetical protein